MIKRILLWLISIYFKPAEPAESQPKENTVKLALTLLINNQIADGLAANTVQATLTDNSDAVQPGAVVNFTADNGATINPANALTDANGQITANLTSSIAGVSVVTATVSDGTVVRNQVSFREVPPLASADSALATGPETASASVFVTVISPLDAMKADFEKEVAFIEHGIEVLGKDAEADLVALRNKFLV